MKACGMMAFAPTVKLSGFSLTLTALATEQLTISGIAPTAKK